MKIEFVNLHQFTKLIQTKRIQIYFFEYLRLQEIIIETNFENFSSFLKQYKKFENVFSKKTIKLLNKTSYNHVIETKKKCLFSNQYIICRLLN